MPTNPPVPATPLDVEACVRLLDDLIRMLSPHDAQSIAYANLLRALRAALPGMAELRAAATHYIAIHNRHDSVYIRENGRHGHSPWAELVDAARAAQPEEGVPRKYFNFHDACLTCAECGGEMAVAYKDGPAEVRCWTCERRAAAAREQAECEAINAVYIAAREMLLDGTGTRAEREAAIEVVGDYYYANG